MGRYSFGQIVLAPVVDGTPDKNPKDRPCVIISKNTENDAGEDFLIIPITKDIPNPCPFYNIIIPHDNESRKITRLKYYSVAKCNWAFEIPQQRIIRPFGQMLDDTLLLIITAYDAILRDPAFNWILY